MIAPGPSAWEFIRGTRRSGFLEYVGELWRKHGDVFQVRIGTRTLLFTIHPDAIEQITASGRKKYDKRASFEPVREFLTGDGLVSSTGDFWRRQRRLMSPLFTPKAIKGYAELMIHDGLRLRERWRELARTGQEVDIAEEMTSVTASIILKSMFSSDTMDSLGEIRGAVETMISFVTRRATGLGLPVWVPTPGNRKYMYAQRLMHRSIGGLIEQRKALPPSEWPDDLLGKLMRARDDTTGEMMADSLLRDESITMFFAGHETTARTMTFAWYALATHPQVSARLHEELERVLAGRVPTVDDLAQLPYALRVVKEVLRLHPPAPFYTRDSVEHDQIGGYDVKPGTIMMLSPYFSHRHRDFWEQPELFDPERWTREREAHSPAFHPFGAGQRVCIGNHFSLLESHLLLVVLAQSFAPRLRADYRARWEMQGVLSLAGGVPMVIAAL